MEKTSFIYGPIVDEWPGEDETTPTTFRETVGDLAEGDNLTIHINSPGGSVTAGIAIANQLRELSRRGVQTVAVVDGVAASIASVIAVACGNLMMYPQSFLMIHNPYVWTDGDAEKLRRDAATLDTMRAALLGFYKLKFSATEDQLKTWMDAETWISGGDASRYGLRCALLGDEGGVRAVAKLRATAMRKFYNTAKVKENAQMDEDEKKDKPEETCADAETVTPEETPAEDPKPEKTAEELLAENAELKAKIAELEAKVAELEADTDKTAEDRVRGMQSRMQSQINAQKKDFENQLTAKAEELNAAKAELTRLGDELKKTVGELSAKTSALAEKENALAQLNAGVLTPGTTEVYTRESARAKLASLPMGERAEFYAKHKAVIG